MRRGAALNALWSVLVLPVAAHAADEQIVSGDVNAGVGYSNNPFAFGDNSTSSGFFQIGATPRFQLRSARSTFTLTGNVQYQRYFRRYSDSTNFGATADYQGTPAEHVTTHARLSYENAIIGSFDNQRIIIDPTQPVPPTNGGADIGLFGTRDRRRTFDAQGDASYAVTARDTITANAFFIDTRFKNFGALGDYDGYGGTLGYSRQLSGVTRVGVQGSGSLYDYKSLRGQTKVYSVQATLNTKISKYWTLDGALGASFTNSDLGGTSSSLSGNINLCRVGERTTTCLAASRAVLPSGFAGTQNQTNLALNWSTRLTEHDSISANVAYTYSGRDRFFPNNDDKYLSLSAEYDRQITRRLRATFTPFYRDVFGGSFHRNKDFGGQIGLAYHFGETR